MSRILFNSGIMQLRSSSVQVIPSGSDAADCVCCGDPLPDCELCGTEPGGPYKRMDYSMLIYGFPSDTRRYKQNVIPGAGFERSFSWEVSGLDVVNGTYSLSTTDSCAMPFTFVDFSITATKKLYDHPGTTFASWNCTSGTLLSTHTYTTLRLSLLVGRFVVNFIPKEGPLASAISFSAGTTPLSVLCVDVSGSNSNAFFEGTTTVVPNCTSNFTYGFDTTTTGVS